MALLAPALAGIPVAEYAAKAVKRAVVGTGEAEKAQVEAMVRRLLPGADDPPRRRGGRAGGRDLPRPSPREPARA